MQIKRKNKLNKRLLIIIGVFLILISSLVIGFKIFQRKEIKVQEQEQIDSFFDEIKIEKQVYQKFEKMFIEKLNYLVFKNEVEKAEGGILNAYQLTNKFESFNKIGKQSGILYYIPAWCTSKIDPVTGFINRFYIKYENLDKSKEFVNKIEDIRYNSREDLFEFDIDYGKFTDKLNDTRNKWTLCSNGERIYTHKNNTGEWIDNRIQLTKEFKKLLKTLDKDTTIIHAHGWTKALSSSVFDIAFKMKFKVVLTLHDYFTACPNGGYFNYKKNEICHLNPLSWKCIKCNCDSRNYGFKLYRVVRQFVQNKIVKLNDRLENVITISEFSEKILKPTLGKNTKITRIKIPHHANSVDLLKKTKTKNYFKLRHQNHP